VQPVEGHEQRGAANAAHTRPTRFKLEQRGPQLRAEFHQARRLGEAARQLLSPLFSELRRLPAGLKCAVFTLGLSGSLASALKKAFESQEAEQRRPKEPELKRKSFGG